MPVKKITEARSLDELILSHNTRVAIERIPIRDIIQAARFGRLTQFSKIGPAKADEITRAVHTAGYIFHENQQSAAVRKFLLDLDDWCYIEKNYGSVEEYESRKELTPEQIAAVLSVLADALKEREYTIMVMHAGLDGNGSRTYEECGEIFRISPERARRLCSITRTTLRGSTSIMQKLREIYRGDLDERPPEAKADNNVLLGLSLERLGLSIRAFNCLYRTGVRTVGDICKMTDYELRRVRNLDPRGQDEVRARLAAMGLSLARMD